MSLSNENINAPFDLDEEFLQDEHPGNRPIEPEDPMMMMADLIEGDPEFMLAGIIEEYARIGWDAEQIMRLFDQPFFQATSGLKKLLGEKAIRKAINDTLQNCGVFQVSIKNQEGQCETEKNETSSACGSCSTADCSVREINQDGQITL